MGNVILAAEGLSYRYAGQSANAVSDVSISAAPGELVAVVGPNGSGKTTLMRLLLGVLPPLEGSVVVVGRPLNTWRRRELARTIAVVSQREEPVFPIRVRQAVLFGRYPHLGPLGAPREGDRAAVASALERCDVASLQHRWVGTLSGGEWQRVRIARALAQEPLALILDEATANLDIRHEMEVFELMAALVRDRSLAGILVTHHVNLAARFADRILVMDRGQACATGPPTEVLTRDKLQQVFDWPVEVIPWRGTPQFVPLRHREISRSGNRETENDS